MSVVRENLMKDPKYTPYCGAVECYARWPRTHFNGEQFECRCGFVTEFNSAFIADWKAKHTEASNPQGEGSGE